MPTISPASRPVKKCYDTLARYDTVGAVHEQAVKTAFQEVLQAAAAGRYTVVPEHSVPREYIRYDGVLKDDGGQMKWGDREITALRYNDSFRLEGFPAEAHRYRLGNRSALDWLFDQYRLKTDKRSGLTHDPNAAFEEDGLVRLIKQVTHVSVETVGVVEGLGAILLDNEATL